MFAVHLQLDVFSNTLLKSREHTFLARKLTRSAGHVIVSCFLLYSEGRGDKSDITVVMNEMFEEEFHRF
jgi:hypothetical protein